MRGLILHKTTLRVKTGVAPQSVWWVWYYSDGISEDSWDKFWAGNVLVVVVKMDEVRLVLVVARVIIDEIVVVVMVLVWLQL